MALSSVQIVLAAEVVRESYTDVEAAALLLNASQESTLLDDLDMWEAIRDSHIKFTGDGVDFDNERKRAAIFYRVRQMLGFPFIVFSLDGVDLTMSIFELEVGRNFG